MLKIKKEDYDFFYPLLSKEKQKTLIPAVSDQGDSVIIDDEENEIDLYDWLNDLVVEKGFDENYKITNVGERLEKLSDYVFSVIEE